MSKTTRGIKFGELTNHIRRTYSTFQRLFAAYGREYLVKSQQSSILVLTRENPGITPAAIAGAIEIERSLMARLLTDLSNRGFIESRALADDGRKKGLYITPRGRKFIRKVMDTFWLDLEAALTKNLTQSERRALIRLLKKIYSPR